MPDLPWRRVVAGWPVERRERWGRRANALLDAGVPWPEDERRAFEEIRRGPQVDVGRVTEVRGTPGRRYLTVQLFDEKG